MARWMQCPAADPLPVSQPEARDDLVDVLREGVRKGPDMDNVKEMKQGAQREAEKIYSELQALGDEIRLKLHLAGGERIDPDAFERQTLAALHMPEQIVMRHRTPQLSHVFAGDSYSAGYYSYLWADTLTADAYEAFTEAGGPEPVSEDPGRWQLIGGGQTNLPESERQDTRAKARQLVLRNPHARNILRLLEAYVTGPGLKLTHQHRTPAASARGDELVAACNELWDRFLIAAQCHYSFTEHARRTWRDGEMFLRKFDTGTWPPQVRFLDPEVGGLLGHPSIGAEEPVDPRGEVRIVADVAPARVMPVVQLGCAQEHAQRTERQAHVRVDQDRPQRSERDESERVLEREAERDGGEVHERLRVEAVERVLAMRGEEVETLRGVVHGVEAPQHVEAMLRAVSPVRDEIAEHEREHQL